MALLPVRLPGHLAIFTRSGKFDLKRIEADVQTAECTTCHSFRNAEWVLDEPISCKACKNLIAQLPRQTVQHHYLACSLLQAYEVSSEGSFRKQAINIA